MSAPEGARRPLALLDNGSPGRRDDPADGALATALAAAGLQRLRLRKGSGFVPGRPVADAPRRSDEPLIAWLVGRSVPPLPPSRHIRWPRPGTPRPAGAAHLPNGAVLIVPGWRPWAGSLPAVLAGRPDLRVVAVLGFPVGLDWPEYVAPTEARALPVGLAAVAHRAAVAIVPDPPTAERLAGPLSRPKTAGPRIVVEPRPSALAGSAIPALDPALARARYMLACGPIEDRGNTPLLLHLWRDLAERDLQPPRLVLAGARGAAIADIAPLLAWSDTLRPLVAEAPDLPADALRRLLVHARALLAPAFADTDGALLRDARACGVPVIAADTPSYRAVLGGAVLSPLDGPGWRVAVRAAADRPPAPVAATLPDWPAYAARVIAHAQAA